MGFLAEWVEPQVEVVAEQLLEALQILLDGEVLVDTLF
jgi:hypothetical protein